MENRKRRGIIRKLDYFSRLIYDVRFNFINFFLVFVCFYLTNIVKSTRIIYFIKKMTDSHCHLNYTNLKENAVDEIKKFIQLGGKYILNIGAKIEDTPIIVEQHLKFEKLFPSVVKSALGFHPEFISDYSVTDLAKALNKYEKILDEYKSILSAVGECGLDYYCLEGKDFIEEKIELQKNSLSRILRKAISLKLPLTLHSRDIRDKDNCINDFLKILAEVGEGKIKASMHSYTGSPEKVNEILDMGLFIGFNAIITYKSGESVREVVKKTPLDRILLETDGPFLPLRAKGFPDYGTPANVFEIAKTIAEIKNVTVEKILAITTENFEELFL